MILFINISSNTKPEPQETWKIKFWGGQLTYLDFGGDVNLNLIIVEDIEIN